ncbi:phosphotransferase [Kineobactrum salinum]|uniref:Phosphotransferase n=1 Tax=Kineobactrum salinum TaxID=2708301 RepID=A0A6C0U8D8_9GAMM|nr:phosphotransferase [Kineobactrum salinum]
MQLPATQAQLSPVAGDASNRRYFRLQLPLRTVIVVDAPPATEKNREFLAVDALLAQSGVRVPEVLAADQERGYLLLEDLGDALLLSRLNGINVDHYYGQALAILRQLAAADTAAVALPEYAAQLLAEELARFPQWFLQRLLGLDLDAGEQAMLAGLDAALIGSALAQPRVLVHRDFHSRNLMCLANDSLAVIDFQDAVLGPVTYDPVSLLRDCYIRWPRARVEQWALGHRDSLHAAGLLPAVDDSTFLHWFDWMGLQRHLKVLGTFARLSLRDGKTAYLADLPLVLEHILEVLQVYAGQDVQLDAFHDWFRQRLQPAIADQSWSGR